MVLRLRKVVRALGWMLTPAVVWGAAMAGFWIGATLGSTFESASVALAVALGMALLAGTATLVWWVSALRRARRVGRRAPAGPGTEVAPPIAEPVLDVAGASPSAVDHRISPEPHVSVNEAAD